MPKLFGRPHKHLEKSNADMEVKGKGKLRRPRIKGSMTTTRPHRKRTQVHSEMMEGKLDEEEDEASEGWKDCLRPSFGMGCQ